MTNIQFKCFFPNYAKWVERFQNTSITQTLANPNMEKFYQLLYDKYADRFLRWTEPSQIVGNMTRYILDTFFQFKLYNEIYDKTLQENTSNFINNDIYGLPGDNTTDTSSPDGKFLVGKNIRGETNSNLQNINMISGLSEMYENILSKTAKWFLPTFPTEETITTCNIR